MFWGLSDVFLVFLPKCNCYKIVQENSVYTCMKRNQCAYSFTPLILFCCKYLQSYKNLKLEDAVLIQSNVNLRTGLLLHVSQ